VNSATIPKAPKGGELDELLKTLTQKVPTELRCDEATLEVVAGPDRGQRLQFHQRARIGSRSLADLRLSDRRVSALHCEISLGSDITLKDLGSKNGTLVGAFRIRDAVLSWGQTFLVGNSEIRISPTGKAAQLPLHPSSSFHGIIGVAPSMRALTAKVAQLADSDVTVLIQGETGSGKERVAEALHLAGRRAAGPLYVVDCGSLAANLVESELFGHERGAFTGADSRREGAFVLAHGGTLMLDEIGELPLQLQSRLLRVLERREVRPLGSGQARTVDVRVVAATHRDLALETSRGRFREDLYHRLAVVTLQVPPLRERLEDIPLLAVQFLEELGLEPRESLTLDALAVLQRHNWPGNVRELRNALQRAVTLMEPLSVPPPVRSEEPKASAPAVDLGVRLPAARTSVVEAFERAYLTALLAECRGNISEAARRAGMDRMSIHRMVQRLGLREPSE
jgi:DNA-binding NtrC family response regulator